MVWSCHRFATSDGGGGSSGGHGGHGGYGYLTGENAVERSDAQFSGYDYGQGIYVMSSENVFTSFSDQTY